MSEFEFKWQLIGEDLYCATFAVQIPQLGTIMRFVEKRNVFDAAGNPAIVRDADGEPILDNEGNMQQVIVPAAVCVAVLPGVTLGPPGTSPPGPGIVLPGPGFNPKGGVQ